MEHFESAVDRVIGGLEKKNLVILYIQPTLVFAYKFESGSMNVSFYITYEQVMSKLERRTVAYHGTCRAITEGDYSATRHSDARVCRIRSKRERFHDQRTVLRHDLRDSRWSCSRSGNLTAVFFSFCLITRRFQACRSLHPHRMRLTPFLIHFFQKSPLPKGIDPITPQIHTI